MTLGLLGRVESRIDGLVINECYLSTIAAGTPCRDHSVTHALDDLIGHLNLRIALCDELSKPVDRLNSERKELRLCVKLMLGDGCYRRVLIDEVSKHLEDEGPDVFHAADVLL